MFTAKSSYWVTLFDDTFSQFKHMGFWEYCFEQFRCPYYQFNHLFDGCHHVFSQEYYVKREWLLPPWLLAVPAFVTIPFLLGFEAQVRKAFQLVKWLIHFVLKREYIVSFISFVCVAAALSLSIFGASRIRRDWLMYPNFNYLSWSYGLACLFIFFQEFASYCLSKEFSFSCERRKESKNLMKMPKCSTQIGQ